jgi:hypothetical protein
VLDVIGIDEASSAQSKRAVTGIERGGTELNGGLARGGGDMTVPAGVLEVSVVIEDVGGNETARLRLSWGEPGWMSNERGIGGDRGASLGIDGVIIDGVGV